MSQSRPPDGAKSSAEALQALQDVYHEVEHLFHQSSSFFERIHGRGEGSMGQRNLLLSLLHRGPQTVPQMAQARGVSRQYIQKLVNQLIKEKLVEPVANPAHRRSPLIRLTPNGRDSLLVMLKQEVEIVREMVIDIPVEKLRETAEMLRTIREWQKDELGRILSERKHFLHHEN
jgi:DNA-binding MarR family transcriptional regulator